LGEYFNHIDFRNDYLKITKDYIRYKMPKTVMDYQKTIIYQFKCNDDTITDIYVGHTTNYLKRRQGHKNDCNNPNGKRYNYKIYKTIRENGGWDNWKMLEICKYPCLDKREAEKKEEEVRMELKAKLNTNRCWTDGKCSVVDCESNLKNNGVCYKHGAVKLLCSVKGCNYFRKTNGVCKTHGYERPLCSVEGCDNVKRKNNVCHIHGGKGNILYCSIEGCDKTIQGKGLCLSHLPKITCDCGLIITDLTKSINQHNKSKTHIAYISSLTI